MFARLSPFDRRDDGTLCVRPFLSGAPRWPVLPGAVLLLAVAIGIDDVRRALERPALGVSSGPDLRDLFGGGTERSRGSADDRAVRLHRARSRASTGSASRGCARWASGHDARELASRFAHSLIPIALAYLVAHYFSLLVFDGQAIAYLLSDPLADGSDLLRRGRSAASTTRSSRAPRSGTCRWSRSWRGTWPALALAHDRALALYEQAREATRSQYWMLVVMVGFTSLGLWLLSSIGER